MDLIYEITVIFNRSYAVWILNNGAKITFIK